MTGDITPDPEEGRAAEPLGHGDHWRALITLESEDFPDFITAPLKHGHAFGRYPAPWPESPCAELIQYELQQASLRLTAIVGIFPETKTLECLSSFPVLTKTSEWIVQVDQPLDDYGAVEGVVEGSAASGHPLCWFAPRFGFETEYWKNPGLARVAFAALALKIEIYPAEPLIIREGPRVEELREELRQAGKHAEAEDPNLEVVYEMTQLRTFYASQNDHHEFVGKILRIRPIKPRPEFPGWLADLECLNDQVETGYVMPLYIFSPALEKGYIPKRGDLVTGFAWLQGTWVAAADQENVASWKKES